MTIQKNRHVCLTAWLILMMVLNSIGVLLYLAFLIAPSGTTAAAIPAWLFPVLVVIGIFNLVCIIALFKWKKWGFWGLLGSSVATFVINVSSPASIGESLTGLLGVAILYGVLNIGADNKGWPQLE